MSEQPAENTSMHIDPYERVWIWISVVTLVVFLIAITIAAFAMGIQVPGPESRVNPAALQTSGEFADPGLRELAPGVYEAYIRAGNNAWNFVPRTITVPAGSEVTFYVTSTDVQHGFKLQDTNINFMVLPGQVSKLTTTFDEPGTYQFICHEYCGAAHAAMFGEVIVEP